ncbi:MAG: TIGR00266 family protein [Myxococcales bacterium]|nr:TIGR00266 family protein [Myxococcales bacterium]
MEFEIHNRPNYASLHVSMKPGDSVRTEAGAMMAMSTGLDMSTSMTGGPWGAFMRWLSGESLFLNTYTASGTGQRIDIAPPQPGDIVHIPLHGNAVITQQGAYIASTQDVHISAKWGGLRGYVSGEGAVMMRCQGTGDLWLSAYGAIQEVQVAGTCIVDTGHIVAFDESLSWFPKPVGNVNSLLRSGEGLVMQFSGNGRVWIQTRDSIGMAEFLHPFRKRRWWWHRCCSFNLFWWWPFGGPKRTG